MRVLDLSYHPSDVRSGKWVDLSRKGNHGTPYGGARPYMIAPGVMGYSFDGSGGNINCGNDESLNMTDVFSIGFWMKGVFSNAHQTIVLKSNRPGNASDSNYQIYYNYTVQKVRFCIGNGSTYRGVYTDIVIESNKWYWFAFVLTPTLLQCYANSSYHATSRTIDPLSCPDKDLLIGSHFNFNYPVKGIMAGIVFEKDKAWSADEVRENMYRSPIYAILRGLPYSVYIKVPWKQTQGGIYVP